MLAVIKSILIIVLISVGMTLSARPSLLTANANTYKVYFAVSELFFKIDSIDDTFLLVFETSRNDSVNGRISYGRWDSVECAFSAQIVLSSDSISIKVTSEANYDPCRGHLDVSDWLWTAFGGSHKYAVRWRNDNKIIVLNDKGSPLFGLEPFQ